MDPLLMDPWQFGRQKTPAIEPGKLSPIFDDWIVFGLPTGAIVT
jgi:hypothetical protein